MKFSTALILGLSSLALLGGCATNRGEVVIPKASVPVTSQTSARKVFIASVTDKREFEANPRMPNILSLSPRYAQNDEIRARAIARKRNNYGRALGDILLPQGQTVTELMEGYIQRAFAEKGYQVVERREEVSKNTLIVDVVVNKFWQWTVPGFWAITMSAEIETALTMKSSGGGKKTKTVYVNESGPYQVGVGRNVVDIISRALNSYVEELKTKIN